MIINSRGIATRQRKIIMDESLDPSVAKIINLFTSARLLVTNSDPTTKQQTIEVAHEAIFEQWNRLSEWIEKTQKEQRLVARMRREAKIWNDMGRPDHLRPNSETLRDFFRSCQILNIQTLDPIVKEFTILEEERLLSKLNEVSIEHLERRDIGDRLAIIGDNREGVGVKNGVPDIVWQPIRGSRNRYIAFKDGSDNFLIPNFFMAKYLVTYAQYEAFVASTNGYENIQWWHDFPNEYQHQNLSSQNFKIDNLPRDSVSWYQSLAFARWLSYALDGMVIVHPYGGTHKINDSCQVRLPTEWEWQWVAQAM